MSPDSCVLRSSFVISMPSIFEWLGIFSLKPQYAKISPIFPTPITSSPADFIAKMQIALKECYESEFWLELLFETDCLSEEHYKKLHNDCGAIRRMLISSLKTVKANRT